MRVNVNFDCTVGDWKWFMGGLNKSLPDDAVVDFRFGNPLRHEYFCSFIAGLERNWTLETSLVGPGLRCLMVNAETLSERCEGIVAKFGGDALNTGLIPWLGQVVKLADVRYNVKAEVPRPVNTDWLLRYAKGPVTLAIEVVSLEEEEPRQRGFGRAGRDCDGERAVIWKDGKYYPCSWCLEGGMRHPVYSYGELGEPFEKKGKQQCHLRFCPR